METFTLELNHYKMDNCYFVTTHYKSSDNPALLIESGGEKICIASVNPDMALPRNHIAIKNWSENEGMDDFLKKIGIIENTPIYSVPSGFVLIPIYPLTEKGKKLFEEK